MQALQQSLAEAEEAHKNELVGLQATIQTSRTKLQDSKVAALLRPSMLFSKPPTHCLVLHVCKKHALLAVHLTIAPCSCIRYERQGPEMYCTGTAFQCCEHVR